MGPRALVRRLLCSSRVSLQSIEIRVPFETKANVSTGSKWIWHAWFEWSTLTWLMDGSSELRP